MGFFLLLDAGGSSEVAPQAEHLEFRDLSCRPRVAVEKTRDPEKVGSPPPRSPSCPVTEIGPKR